MAPLGHGHRTSGAILWCLALGGWQLIFLHPAGLCGWGICEAVFVMFCESFLWSLSEEVEHIVQLPQQ